MAYIDPHLIQIVITLAVIFLLGFALLVQGDKP